jgi:esterase/lipase
MSENILIDDIPEELKNVHATQYDISQIRKSLYEIKSHLQKIYNAIEVNKASQAGICGVQNARTTTLENKVGEIDKRVRDLEDNSDVPKDVEDLKNRMNKLEKMIYMGLGALAILQILIPIITHLLWTVPK